MTIQGLIKKINRKIKASIKYMIKNKSSDNFKKFYNINLIYDRKNKVCHYKHLFITTKGDISPCCGSGFNPKHVIANINDNINNLKSSLKSFSTVCNCEKYCFTCASPADVLNIETLHMELAYTCNGKCAMCGTKCPDWRGKFDSYDKLEQIIDLLQPKTIIVQGGEVLIQKKSLDWLVSLKNKYPDMKFEIITNGNVDIDMVPLVSNLFHSATISIVGFQAETYKKIMGLDFAKTERFIKELKKYEKTRLCLKYLITPINIHESNLFLNWAIGLSPNKIFIGDCDINQYIRSTGDNYWNKIAERTFRDIQETLFQNKDKLISENIKISFDSNVRQIFKINDDFLNNPELNKFIFWHKRVDYKNV